MRWRLRVHIAALPFECAKSITSLYWLDFASPLPETNTAPRSGPTHTNAEDAYLEFNTPERACQVFISKRQKQS